MITNEAGQVALKRYRNTPKIVKVGNMQYLFSVRANICMAWVESEHIGSILAMKRVCCGGNRKPDFTYANESDVRRWENGGGR